jgi:hypothetical protein
MCLWCKKESTKDFDICEACKLECPKCGRKVTTQMKWSNKDMALTWCEPCGRWVDYHPITAK